jgi:catechol 2,3-dioxygenase-like lactoylglutathione lyase family enzyme
MIRSLHHTAISTPDLKRAVDFYRDLFGFEVVLEMDWPQGYAGVDLIMGIEGTAAKAVMLRREDSMIEIFEFSSPEVKSQAVDRPVCDHGITHLCFYVEEIEAEYERLSQSGMLFHCPPQDSGTGIVATYGRDPDGNVIELLEILDEEHPFRLKV